MAEPAWWAAVQTSQTSAAQGAPGASPASATEPPEAIIRRVAGSYGFADPDLLVATARQESGLNPTARGDFVRGVPQSFGLFQENVRGRGAGLAPEQSFDVAAATQRAIAEFNAIRQRNPTVDRGTWAALAQRPRDQAGYARQVNAWLASPATAAPATPAQQSAASAAQPAWWAAVPDRAAGVTPMAGTPSARPTSGGGAIFPVAGYTGQVQLHHGDSKAVGGSDLMAAEGTPVLAMAPGRVQWANYEPVGGNNVGILGDDGLTYYYAHLRDAPAVKAGQQVGAGTPLGAVGRTGNAAGTPPHLHLGIGRGIIQGVGSLGGLGRDFDAVSYLRQTLTGASPAHPQAPTVGQVTSTAPAWWAAVTRR